MPTLYIANKNYSSWSLRPWVLLRALGVPFDERLVPFLILVASAAVLAQPRIRLLAGSRTFPVAYPLSLFVVAVYGGYFGAGAGVVFMALTLICTACVPVSPLALGLPW